ISRLAGTMEAELVFGCAHDASSHPRPRAGSADPAGPEFPAVYSLLIRRAAAASDDGLGRDIRRSSDRVLRHDGGGASNSQQPTDTARAEARLGGTGDRTESG